MRLLPHARPSWHRVAARALRCKNKIRNMVTVVTDYGPGIDAEKAFSARLVKNGGKITEAIRVPLRNPEFAPFIQRIKDDKPDAVFVFVPAGEPADRRPQGRPSRLSASDSTFRARRAGRAGRRQGRRNQLRDAPALNWNNASSARPNGGVDGSVVTATVAAAACAPDSALPQGFAVRTPAMARRRPSSTSFHRPAFRTLGHPTNTRLSHAATRTARAGTA